MASISSNKFQKRQSEVFNETMSPGTGTHHSAMGVLVEIYDTERLESIQIPPDLARKIENAPGLLFAKVVMANNRTLVLPFKEPEDSIYLTYGNGFYLEGRSVKVTWQGMAIDSGVIEIARSWTTPHFNIAAKSATFDIGGLF